MSLKIKLVSIFLLLFYLTNGQSKIRFPLWTFHDDSTTIIGFSAGLTSNEERRQVTTVGLHFELLGLGVIAPLWPSSPISDSFSIEKIDRTGFSERVYGINISPFGTFTYDIDIHGLNISGIASLCRYANGLTISGIFNYAEVSNGGQLSFLGNEVRQFNGLQVGLFNRAFIKSSGLQFGAENYSVNHIGIQIGIYNRAKKLKGVQLGLWNVTDKRKFPILNW